MIEYIPRCPNCPSNDIDFVQTAYLKNKLVWTEDKSQLKYNHHDTFVSRSEDMEDYPLECNKCGHEFAEDDLQWEQAKRGK